MSAPLSSYKDRQFLAVIGDEDSVTGLLLAGIGHISTPSNNPTNPTNPLSSSNNANESESTPSSEKNFLVVDARTTDSTIERAFDKFTSGRKDIAILLINQHIAERIRDRVEAYTAAFPAVLEIPSKDHPYDPEKDSVLRRVRRLFGY